MSLLIELSIKTMSEGLLYLYDQEDERDIEIPVEFEWDYSPAEKMSHNYPGCEEELILESVKAEFGFIDIDTVANLDQFYDDALECMRDEAEDSRY